MIREVSVLVGNTPGQSARIASLLAKSGINVEAFYVSEGQGWGVVKIICSSPDVAVATLRAANYSVTDSYLLAIPIPDTPGRLAELLSTLSEKGINIRHAYSTWERGGNLAVVLLMTSDQEMARDALLAGGFQDTDSLCAAEEPDHDVTR